MISLFSKAGEIILHECSIYSANWMGVFCSSKQFILLGCMVRLFCKASKKICEYDRFQLLCLLDYSVPMIYVFDKACLNILQGLLNYSAPTISLFPGPLRLFYNNGEAILRERSAYSERLVRLFCQIILRQWFIHSIRLLRLSATLVRLLYRSDQFLLQKK